MEHGSNLNSLELEIENKIESNIKNIKNTINFDFLPQKIKNLEIFNIYNDNESLEELANLRNIIMQFVKEFI